MGRKIVMGLTSHRQALPGTEAASLDLADQAISERKPLKPFTDIITILDRSGSMESIRTDTEGGFNAFVQKQRESHGDCALSLYQFDDVYEVVYENRPIAQVPPLQLEPRNMTALLDAIGSTVNARGAYYDSLPEAERPEKVVVVVMTDGEENSSREFNLETVRKLITRQREVYKWEFIFLGANMDAVAEGARMGFQASKSMNYAPDGEGVMYCMASASDLVSNFKMKLIGEAMDDFSAEDRAKSGGKKKRRG